MLLCQYFSALVLHNTSVEDLGSTCMHKHILTFAVTNIRKKVGAYKI